MKRNIGQDLEDPECRHLCPGEVGVCHPLVDMDMCSPAWKVSEPIVQGFFMEVSSHMLGPLLTQSSSHLPSREDEAGCEFQAYNHSLVPLVTSPHSEGIQEPTKSCLIRTKDSWLLSPRKF